MENRTIIYSNYLSDEAENSAREYLFEEFAEEKGWKNPDDIPDQDVWDEMDFESQIFFEDAIRELKPFFDGKYVIIQGSCGLWNGKFAAGTVEYDFDKWFYKTVSVGDYVEICDVDGHLYINVCHHDGTNSFEVKFLTARGVSRLEHWEENWDAPETEQEIHGKLFSISGYSVLPKFAHKVYGAPLSWKFTKAKKPEVA